MLLWFSMGTVAADTFYEDVEYMSEHKVSNKGRVIVKAAADGENAADDFGILIMASGYELARIYNLGTDGSLDGDAFTSVYGFVPPGSEIQLKAITASTDEAFMGLIIKDA